MNRQNIRDSPMGLAVGGARRVISEEFGVDGADIIDGPETVANVWVMIMEVETLLTSTQLQY